MMFDKLGRVPGFHMAHVHVMTRHGEYAAGKHMKVKSGSTRSEDKPCYT